MGCRLWLILLVTVGVGAVASSSSDGSSWGHAHFVGGRSGLCNSALGECIGEEHQSKSSDSEMTRRQMAAGRQRYISYAALAANNIPCNQRGSSYYNCNAMAKANPYSRGCSAITRCMRDTS